eukprot:NODE_891_length_2266_cov_60.871209_g758_i0.p2 GENE.NODE_891_length_2266_cov_60.871209_g758_i0~~NODE_891_length_2266_cov_60.871209_g758_i0.p2  ORF type:complete len:232 (-),score=11.99 NODE_891_length_2266_cov_60.871209_g758_i0:1360-2055(-)
MGGAACRLEQVASSWGPQVVFVAVVDPGVGTGQHSLILRTKQEQYFVGPDNGVLSLVAQKQGIDSIVQIDLERSGLSLCGNYTSSGKELYAKVAARLILSDYKMCSFGEYIESIDTTFGIKRPEINGDILNGIIKSYDAYGNIWTNIDAHLIREYGLMYESQYLITIQYRDNKVFAGRLRYAKTFGNVGFKEQFLFINNYDALSLGTNMGNFMSDNNIGCSPYTKITIGRE